MASIPSDHIAVCICTFKRPDLLKKLLSELLAQETGGLFTYSIVVTDNDRNESAKETVNDFAGKAGVGITYCVEPVQNIALARNRAVESAIGSYVAFIDDDEYPSATWLLDLYLACNRCGADGVLGPVLPYFAAPPPEWVTRGSFFDRPRHATGSAIGPRDMRTSNVILRREVLQSGETPFRAEFGTGGEDVDFFRRMVAKGCKFVWCDESVVYELVPESRFRRRYLLRRALNRGNNSFKFREGRKVRVMKALVALPVYGLSLPFLLAAGQHHFMKYLIKLCDHTGYLLAFLRITLFREYK